MTTIRSAIQIQDMMSKPLISMNNALNIVLNSFEAVQTASANAIDINSIRAARSELANIEVEFIQIEENIKHANDKQKGFNDNIRNGHNLADTLGSKIKGVITAFGGIYAIKTAMNMSDEVSQTKARLDLMNDGLQTIKELQDMIYQSAERSRGSYLDTAQTVAKLGLLAKDSFSSNQEAILFAEQLNKQFKIGGSSIQEQQSSMYQLTQAMAAGKLQGDEFRSIMENAPMLAQSIAEYMGLATGELKEMSSQGLITADIIKNAMFASAERTNEMFEQIPITFGEIMRSIKNDAIRAFDPVFERLSAIANSPGFDVFVNNIIIGLIMIANTIMLLLEIITSVASFFTDNWGIIEPIVWGIVGALGVYAGYLAVISSLELVSSGIKIASAIASYAHASATRTQASATATAAAAQYGLNTALLASPITWIIIAIIALIAIFYAVIGVINKFAGTSISATGIIVGTFFWLGSVIGNIFFGLVELVFGIIESWYNWLTAFANFFGNVFENPISSIIYLFTDMADNILGVIEKIASAMDFVFGSNMADTVAGWRSGLRGLADKAVAEFAPDENYGRIMNELDLSVGGLGINRFDNTDAWDKGYSAGRSLEEKFNFDSLLDSIKPGSEFTPDYSLIGGGIEDTALNTAAMKDSMSTSEEDLKYLRDLAEQETINRFTTAELKIELTSNNTISSDMDLDGVVSYLEEKVTETLESAAEGVHM